MTWKSLEHQKYVETCTASVLHINLFLEASLLSQDLLYIPCSFKYCTPLGLKINSNPPNFLWCLRENPWKVANLGSRSTSYSTIINIPPPTGWRSWMNLLCLTWCHQDRRGDVSESTDILKTTKKLVLWVHVTFLVLRSGLERPQSQFFFLIECFLGTKAIPDLVTKIFVSYIPLGK